MKAQIIYVFLCVSIWQNNAIDVATFPRKLGEFHLPLPAFMELYLLEDDSLPLVDRYVLYVSTFNPAAFGQTDPVYFLPSPGRYLDQVPNWTLTQLDKSAFWPNNPDLLPSSVLGVEGVIWTSGFLVPTKTNGQLQIYDMKSLTPNETVINIAGLDSVHYSYHRVIWKDMDGDGDKDALTARFHNGDQVQELVWMENSGQLTSDPWQQHVIVSGGPDVHFRNIQLNSNGSPVDCIFAGEFWKERVTMYCIEEGAATGWNEFLITKVIDDTVGQTFDLLIEDFNNDGRLDLLVTAYNHSTGNVFVYEIPDDLENGEWIRHTIAEGFVPNFILGGQSMSPGSPKTFYPTAEYANEVLPDGRHHRKWIALSGDDDGKVYILRPNSDDVQDWSLYEKAIVVDTQKTTSGKMAVADIDGDGYSEFIAAGYSAGLIYVFTYAP